MRYFEAISSRCFIRIDGCKKRRKATGNEVVILLRLVFLFREYLKDLIESNHIFMKMLENYCKRHRAMVVQKKPKVVKRKKKPKSKLRLA